MLPVGDLLRRLQELMPILDALEAAEKNRPALQVEFMERDGANFSAKFQITGQRFRDYVPLKIEFQSTAHDIGDQTLIRNTKFKGDIGPCTNGLCSGWHGL